MTTGFPDFQRGPAAVTAVLLDTSGPIDTFYDFGAFPMSGWPNVSFIFDTSSSVNYYYVEVRWNRSLALNDYVDKDVLVFGPGYVSAVMLAAKAAYCQIHVVNLTGTVTQTVTTQVYGSVSYERPAAYKPLAFVNQSIGAGAAVSSVINRVVPGTVTLSLWNSANHPGHASLDYWDSGALGWEPYTFTEVTASVRASNVVAGLPAAPCRLTVTNDDTSARSFIGAVTLQS